MRIVQVHNHHLVSGGSETMFAATVKLLREAGHHVSVFEKSNADIVGVTGSVRAAFSGLYSFAARSEFGSFLDETMPDLVHAHNLFPRLSSSVLDACTERGIPAVMRLADFSLICPAAHHFCRGEVCERCVGGREYHCVLRRCRGGLLRSSAYAARTAAVRRGAFFPRSIQKFIAPTAFVRTKYVAAGLPSHRIEVIPNMVPAVTEPALPTAGTYIGYAGRVSPEKGIAILMRAAAACGLPVRIAGERVGDVRHVPATSNVEFVGRLEGSQLVRFYRASRIIVVPSVCLESFGLSAAEAMSHGIPVVASRIGGLAELIRHGETGILVRPGDSNDLARALIELWNDPKALTRLGSAGHHEASTKYSAAAHYARLLSVYESVAGTCRACTRGES